MQVVCLVGYTWLIALRDSAAPEDNGLVSNHLHAEIARVEGKAHAWLLTLSELVRELQSAERAP